jgi:hypothetical protein
MRILIVYSGGRIFGSLAERLHSRIAPMHAADIACEEGQVSAWTVLKQRIRRAGIVAGMSQLLFKLLDVALLRSEIRRHAESLTRSEATITIASLNSQDARAFLEQQRYDIVVAIATSILQEATLRLAGHGFINIHPGILPQYRGIGNFWAVAHGDHENIGYTVHWMTPAIDKGAIICQGRLGSDVKGLWEMNYRALRLAVDELGQIINAGKVLDARVEVDESNSRYYSWNGIADYLVFLKQLKARRP